LVKMSGNAIGIGRMICLRRGLRISAGDVSSFGHMRICSSTTPSPSSSAYSGGVDDWFFFLARLHGRLSIGRPNVIGTSIRRPSRRRRSGIWRLIVDKCRRIRYLSACSVVPNEILHLPVWFHLLEGHSNLLARLKRTNLQYSEELIQERVPHHQ
jgi:hypothetical protein